MTPENAEIIAEATGLIANIPATDDPRLYDVYLRRARARFGEPDSAAEVRRDLELTARCARSQGGSRLLKIDPSRLKTRRLEPLHLTLCTPDPSFVEAMGGVFGLPLLAFYARTATNDIITEVRAMSSAFRTGTVDGPVDTTGLAAASYTGALGQIAHGDVPGARALLRKLERGLDAAPDSAAPPPAGQRLLHGCAALAAIAARSVDSLHASLREIATIPGEPLDLMMLGLIGAATLETMTVRVDRLALEPALVAVADDLLQAWAAVD